MAEVDTNYLAEQHSDIRLEQQKQAHDLSKQMGADTNEIVKEGLKGDYNTLGAIKDSRFETVSRVESNADRLERSVGDIHKDAMDRFYSIGRDTMDLRAQVTALGSQVRADSQISALQTEKAVLQNTIEGQKNTQYLSDKITSDGEKTRALLNDLKYHDLSRGLVERNAEIVELASEGRHWRHKAEQNQFAGQWAALQSQIQAFASQLQETRQGMVNFGTMAGVGQTSTSNNVR